jgi:wyosine [tRNA(Phe)-imidazoG37] synthetase (radical SAM superfamily)
MPFIEDVRTFAKDLTNILPEYEIIKEHIPSRVILLIKKSLNKKSWINFPKFFELTNSKKKFTTEDYSSNVMESNK